MKQLTLPSDNLPSWLCTAFADEDQVFLPCGIFGSEFEETLCLAFDGVGMVRDEGHTYAPAEWLAREYPDKAEKIRMVANSVKEKIRVAERASKSKGPWNDPRVS